MVVLILALLLRREGGNTLVVVGGEKDDECQGNESKMVVAIRMIHGLSRRRLTWTFLIAMCNAVCLDLLSLVS